MQSQSVCQYFRGKSVLLTGATGFFGQYVVYKLVKSCEPANIFILLRPKKNETVKQRFEKMLSSEIFKSVDHKVMRDKVVAIEGDVTQKEFGFTPNVYGRLNDSEVFIHLAANIQLNRTLSESLLSNTNATRNALEVRRELPKLKKFVYVSTTYSYDQTVLEEKVKNFPLSAVDVNEVLDCFLRNTELGVTLKNKLESKNWMNNYSLSKTLSEILVAEESKKLDTLIFRPSMLIPSNKEPFTGWFFGSQAFSNIAVYISSGLWQVSNINPQDKLPSIPVDMCGNALLKAITSQSAAAVTEQRLTVINAVTNNIPFEYVCKQFKTQSKSHPPMNFIRPVARNFDAIHNNRYLTYKRWFVETFFAIGADFLFQCFGLRATLQKKVRQMHQFFDGAKELSDYFREIKNDKLRRLWTECCNEDKQLFNFDPLSVNMEEIFATFYRRLRKQMNGGKEVDETEVQKRQLRVKLIYYSTIIVGPLLILLLVSSLITFVVTAA